MNFIFLRGVPNKKHRIYIDPMGRPCQGWVPGPPDPPGQLRAWSHDTKKVWIKLARIFREVGRRDK